MIFKEDNNLIEGFVNELEKQIVQLRRSKKLDNETTELFIKRYKKITDWYYNHILKNKETELKEEQEIIDYILDFMNRVKELNEQLQK